MKFQLFAHYNSIMLRVDLNCLIVMLVSNALIGIEQAQFFWVQAELELWVLSPDEPEPVKISLEPDFLPEHFTKKNAKYQFESTSSLLEN